MPFCCSFFCAAKIQQGLSLVTALFNLLGTLLLCSINLCDAQKLSLKCRARWEGRCGGMWISAVVEVDKDGVLLVVVSSSVLLDQVVVHAFVLNGFELASRNGANPASFVVQLLVVDREVLWVVGGEGALLTLDLFAQVFGVDMTGDVLRHFSCELAVQALVAADPPVLVVVDPVLSLLVCLALGPGLELLHRRPFANSTQVLVPPPRFRNTASRRL